MEIERLQSQAAITRTLRASSRRIVIVSTNYTGTRLVSVIAAVIIIEVGQQMLITLRSSTYGHHIAFRSY